MAEELTILEPRATLARAIEEFRDADARAAKARDAAVTASRMIDAAEREHEAALASVEDARQAHTDRLVAAAGANRGAPANDSLRRARTLAADAEDRVIAARAAFEQLQATATSTLAAAKRADARRREAIYAVVHPELSRLLQTAEQLTRALGETRTALKFVNDNLIDPYSESRRGISRVLNHGAPELFPREFGLRAEPSAALAAWTGFAEAIAKDADASFPD